MKQFAFKIVNPNNNCKSTLLIQAKDLDDAIDKVGDAGFVPLETKKTTKKLPVMNGALYFANQMLGEAMLEAPEDYGLI